MILFTISRISDFRDNAGSSIWYLRTNTSYVHLAGYPVLLLPPSITLASSICASFEAPPSSKCCLRLEHVCCGVSSRCGIEEVTVSSEGCFS